MFGVLDVLLGGHTVFSVAEKAFIKNTNLDPESPVPVRLDPNTGSMNMDAQRCAIICFRSLKIFYF